MEIFVDDETKLTLHGLQQYYVKLKDNEKNRKLFDLLDVLEFNQVSIEGLCRREHCSCGRSLCRSSLCTGRVGEEVNRWMEQVPSGSWVRAEVEYLMTSVSGAELCRHLALA